MNGRYEVARLLAACRGAIYRGAVYDAAYYAAHLVTIARRNGWVRK